MEPESKDARPNLSPVVVLLFYGAMVAVASGLALLFDVPSLWTKPARAPGPVPLWIAVGAGLGLGLATHGVGEATRRIFGWGESFHRRLADLIGPLSRLQVVVAAAASGIAEELLFRGALQPIVGLFPQAILFGLVHIGRGREFRYWPFYAGAMGLCFGFLYEVTGTILPAILAHFTVNFFGLSSLGDAGEKSHPT